MTKILIVEDEAGLRQGLEINLRLENYETAQAADGAPDFSERIRASLPTMPH